ncbi:putative P450 monooxygenase [Delphinella strobiligena]|nr:putative P450 monooxygenase [Delphinella strobiligena]
MPSPVIGTAILAIVFFGLRYLLNQTDTPKIRNLPEIPGVPIFGNLLQLGSHHAKVAQGWAKQYGPVFQTRLGNRRTIFVNSFDSVKKIWIQNQSSLISRPTLHTFHTVVSSSEGFTIGTSPWDESCKARRKAAATALNKPAVQSYMPFIDFESCRSIKEMLEDSKGGAVDLDPNPYFQRYALSTSLMLNYGVRIQGSIDNELLKEITQVERIISNFRSTSNQWQDYIPLLRLWPSGNTKPLEYKERRGAYMSKLLGMLKENIKNGTDKPCITGNILKDPEAKLNDAEVMSICLTMVSAGLDTVPGNLVMCLAYLSSEHGQEIQKRALEEINKVYPDNDAWEKCLVEEKVTYITALVKEVLRYWTVIPICLPRTSIKDIEWEDAIIPAGTTFYMNAYAADYDETHFDSPMKFNPDRYIADESSSVTGTPHYGYGAGSRMCVGSHLANRELYTAFLRLITAFEILPPRLASDKPILDSLEANAIPTGLTMEPKPFKIGIRARNKAQLDRWIRESEGRTKDL